MKSELRFNIDWVLINELALGPAPTKDRHIRVLEKEGIKSILSLCSQKEAPPPKDLNKKFITRRVILPDHKTSESPSLNELVTALNTLKELYEYKPVFVHCVASIERSPLVCLGWLIRENGLNQDRALEYLMQIHPRTNPLPKQLQLLNKSLT